MNPAALLPLVAGFPLLLAALLPSRIFGKHSLRLLPFAAVPALLAAVLLPDGARIVIPHALLEASWTLDPTGRIFLLFTALGWLLAGLFAMTYLRGQAHPGAFVIPFLFAMSGNLTLTAASDAVTFYSGFAVMSFASWGLVVHDGTPAARRAGRIYLALVVIGELMVLPGMVSGALRAGSAELSALRAHWTPADAQGLPLFLLFFGFAIKAGLFPFHFWLPIAHPAAPTPASAVLSGCMINAGLLGIVRFLPLGHIALPLLSDILFALAAVGILGAPVAGLLQRHPKAMLAYSSVAKMSIILLLLVPALRDPALAAPTVAVVGSYAAFHGLHKVALFLGYAVTPMLGRLGWCPILLLAASFLGFPGLAGAQAKSAITQLLLRGEPSHIGLLISLGGFLGTLLLLRFAWLTRPGSSNHKVAPATARVWLCAVCVALVLPYGVVPHFKPIDPFLLAALPVAAFGWRYFRGLPCALAPGDWIAILPAYPRETLHLLARKLARTEQRLAGPPGGLLQLLLFLLLILILNLA